MRSRCPYCRRGGKSTACWGLRCCGVVCAGAVVDARTGGYRFDAVVGADLFFLRVAIEERERLSAVKIRFSSSESSAKLCFLYSSTVVQPNSDLSARRTCFCLSASMFSPSSSSVLILSSWEVSAPTLALPIVSNTFWLNLNWSSLAWRLNLRGSANLSFLISFICCSEEASLERLNSPTVSLSNSLKHPIRLWLFARMRSATSSWLTEDISARGYKRGRNWAEREKTLREGGRFVGLGEGLVRTNLDHVTCCIQSSPLPQYLYKVSSSLLNTRIW